MQSALFIDQKLFDVKHRKIEAYFDGACEPKNPGGNMGMGALVLINEIPVLQYSGFSPVNVLNSNNVAEYMALDKVLEYLLVNGITKEHVFIYGDSKLVVMQMQGTWKMKGGLYTMAATECKNKLRMFAPGVVHIQWIPRDKNERADKLSKAAFAKNGVKLMLQKDNTDVLK